jgi:hypothetical protein
MDTLKIKSKNFKNWIDLRLGMARKGGERTSKDKTPKALDRAFKEAVCIS